MNNDLIIAPRNLPATKAGINTIAKRYKKMICNGDVDPIKADYSLKVIEELVSSIRKDEQVKNTVIDEVDKYQGQFNGVSLTLGSSTKYDYSHDATWTAVNDEIIELKKKLKERENYLQGLKKTMIDQETGEEVSPPKTKEINFVKWEFPKK